MFILGGKNLPAERWYWCWMMPHQFRFKVRKWIALSPKSSLFFHARNVS